MKCDGNSKKEETTSDEFTVPELQHDEMKNINSLGTVSSNQGNSSPTNNPKISVENNVKFILPRSSSLKKESGNEMEFNFFADTEPDIVLTSFAEKKPAYNFFVDEGKTPIVKKHIMQPPHPYGGKFNTCYLCTDGGSRSSDSMAATGWVLYNSKWSLIHAKGTSLTSGTNNDAEMMAALDGIEYVMTSKRNMRIIHLTDSKLVEGGITGTSKLNARRHQLIRNKIMSIQGKNGNYILSYQIPREANSGADRMCNLSMDSLKTTYQFDVYPIDIEEDREKTQAHVSKNLYSKFMHYSEAAMLVHNNRFKMVLSELVFKHSSKMKPCSTPGGSLHVKTVNGEDYVTGFETVTSYPTIDGIERVIPIEAVSKIKEECERHGIEWHNEAFARNKYLESSTPDKDIALLSGLCRAIGNDVSTIIKWYRNQTVDDNRPNKHLRPELYEKHLKDYPGLEDLCKIARNGFHSRVTGFSPPRPFTKNHQSAIMRANAVQRKLIKEAMNGKTLILELETASMDSRVNTCPYAVAPKNNVDYTVDGRLIHDGSFPQGSSVNDAVPPLKLDASTDDVKDIARRILCLYGEFPGTAIYGMAADVDSAFQNAHANELSALLFGGSFPGAPYVAIALTAIFGYKDSPAIFALLAKAAQFYHKNGKSEINNIPTPFWNWVWVDDFVGIEPDIDDRLSSSENHLRTAFHLVFGSPGWNNSKYAPWSNHLHAVGLDWNLMNGTVSMPRQKIDKALLKIQDCLDMIENQQAPTLKMWRSLVGTLRHVGSCVPAATPFYQSFVSTEKVLISHGIPQWSTLLWDLKWFRSILNESNLNGVTMERFIQSSDRTIILYLGWNSTNTFLMDFYNKITLSVPDSGGSLGGVLLEYYICTNLITPFGYGPFPRTDLKIDLKCQTVFIAKRIRNWQFQNHSLRQLGWLCTQQHILLVSSGPKIGNINLASYTNVFLQEPMDQEFSVTPITPLMIPSVNELSSWSAPALDLEPEKHTTPNSKHGLSSAIYSTSTEKHFTFSIQMLRMKFSKCLLQQSAWGMDPAFQYARKHSVTFECLPLNASTKRTFITKSQEDCVWTWAWKGTNASTPPPTHKDSHLVPCLCEPWVNNYSSKETHSPSSLGDVLSWGSSLFVEPEKCGDQSRKRILTTSSCGRTSHTDMVSKSSESLMTKPSGWTSTLPPPKATDIKKALRFDLEETLIRCYVPSRPFGGFKKEEAILKSGIMTRAEFLKSKVEWSSIGKPSSIGSRK